MKELAQLMIASNANLDSTARERLKAALNTLVWKDTTAHKEA